MSKPALLLLIVLGGVCVAEGVLLVRLETRLSRMEAESGGGPSARAARRGESGSLVAPAAEFRVLRERVTVLEQEREALRLSIVSDATPEDGTPGTAPGLPEAARQALEKHLETIVERKLEERAKKEKSNVFDEGNKPSISELAKAVEMTADQEDATVRTIDEGKRRMWELLGLRRADGTTMLDDLVSVIRDSDDPQKEMQRWIQRLITEKIPGRSESYIAEIMKIKSAAWDGLGRSLSEEQVTRLRRTGVDILEVKTGYDPFEELLTDD